MALSILEAFGTGSIDLYRDDELIRDLQRLNIVEDKWAATSSTRPKRGGGHAIEPSPRLALPIAIKLAHSRAMVHTAPTRMNMPAQFVRHGVQTIHAAKLARPNARFELTHFHKGKNDETQERFVPVRRYYLASAAPTCLRLFADGCRARFGGENDRGIRTANPQASSG